MFFMFSKVARKTPGIYRLRVNKMCTKSSTIACKGGVTGREYRPGA